MLEFEAKQRDRRLRNHTTSLQNGFGKAPELHFEVMATSTKQRPTFHQTVAITTFTIHHNLGKLANIFYYEKAIDEGFENLLQPYIVNTEPNDRISVTLNGEKFNHPIYVNARKDLFCASGILDSLFEVSQSAKEILLDGILQVEVQVTKNASGRGRKAPQSFEEKCYGKR